MPSDQVVGIRRYHIAKPVLAKSSCDLRKRIEVVVVDRENLGGIGATHRRKWYSELAGSTMTYIKNMHQRTTKRPPTRSKSVLPRPQRPGSVVPPADFEAGRPAHTPSQTPSPSEIRANAPIHRYVRRPPLAGPEALSPRLAASSDIASARAASGVGARRSLTKGRRYRIRQSMHRSRGNQRVRSTSRGRWRIPQQ